MLKFFINPVSKYALNVLDKYKNFQKDKVHDLNNAWGGSELVEGIKMKNF